VDAMMSTEDVDTWGLALLGFTLLALLVAALAHA